MYGAEMLAHTLSYALILLALVLAYAIRSWVQIKLREFDMKSEKLRFHREQFEFARARHDEARDAQLKMLGNMAVPGFVRGDSH